MAAATPATAATTAAAPPRVDVLMVGTGEYTTGYGASSAKTDKSAGVVALTCMDLRSRGKVGRLLLAGTNGSKFPAILAHMQRAIVDAYPASHYDVSAVETFPAESVTDPFAYRAALAALPRGSAVIIFTPDDTHFGIAMDAVAAGHHVLVTKPIVKTLEQHVALAAAAEKANVLVAVEVHKRWDPLYTDARDRARRLGDLALFQAYMSQPKLQLETFRAWAGISSDISYYLNSHHIDLCEWMFGDRSRPTLVTAVASSGIACKTLGRPCEDAISIHATWETPATGSRASTSYTACWTAPPSDVHSQQRFFAQCHAGEITVDQAHRGYTVATDAAGYASPNPLFMKYTPDEGRFVGQAAYGYRSFEVFLSAVQDIAAGRATPRDYDRALATVHTTYQTTAILEAGRRSLDSGGMPVAIEYDAATSMHPMRLRDLAPTLATASAAMSATASTAGAGAAAAGGR